MCSGAPDAPGSHGTWNGRLVKGFDPLPGEHVFQKHRYSSFYGTAFNEYLREHDAEYLVICGSSTGNCVITTAMNGWERNYKVIVLADKVQPYLSTERAQFRSGRMKCRWDTVSTGRPCVTSRPATAM